MRIATTGIWSRLAVNLLAALQWLVLAPAKEAGTDDTGQFHDRDV
jgi:hypothetical protein